MSGTFDMRRLARHLIAPEWPWRRRFPPAARAAVAKTIAASEGQHRGELRFVVEGPLPLADALRGTPARARAIELFSRLRVWDTAENSGILIYLQMVDRRVEIVADRGIAARVPQAEWDALCRRMEEAFRVGDFLRGSLDGIAAATRLLVAHFPAAAVNPNELPDEPLLL